MVDWKAIPKIDAHIHLLPQDVIDANKGYSDRFDDGLVFFPNCKTKRNLIIEARCKEFFK